MYLYKDKQLDPCVFQKKERIANVTMIYKCLIFENIFI